MEIFLITLIVAGVFAVSFLVGWQLHRLACAVWARRGHYFRTYK